MRAAGAPVLQNTAAALDALAEARAASPAVLGALGRAWRLQQDLSQLLGVALAEGADPSGEPRALRALLTRTGGVRDFRALKGRLTTLRRAAHAAFEAVVAAAATEPPPLGR